MATDYHASRPAKGGSRREWPSLLVGLWRLVQFARLVLPIVLHYNFVQFAVRWKTRQDRDRAYEQLHNMYAPRCFLIAWKMKGYYIKVGEFLSMVSSALLPPVYSQALRPLLDDCPWEPFEVVREIVETELGAALEDTFQSFDTVPLKAASVAQVHGATLRGGHSVAVKVQYRAIEDEFKVDMLLFLLFAQLLARPFVCFLHELNASLDAEFDFEQEACLQREAAQHLEDFPDFAVPEPVDWRHDQAPGRGLCTKRLLVMDRLEGVTISDWSRNTLKGAVRSPLQQQRVPAYTRPKKCNFVFTALVEALADVVDVVSNSALETLGLADDDEWENGNAALHSPYDVLRRMDAVQEHLIFNAGFVHADPHAGNVMLLDDRRIGLVDWGRVARLTMQQRSLLARLVIAMTDGDEVLAAKCYRALGARTALDLEWSYTMHAKAWLCSLLDKSVLRVGGAFHMQEVLNSTDRLRKPADDPYLMTFKSLVLTRQVYAMLGYPRLNSSDALYAAARRHLQAAGEEVPRAVPTTVVEPTWLQAS